MVNPSRFYRPTDSMMAEYLLEQKWVNTSDGRWSRMGDNKTVVLRVAYASEVQRIPAEKFKRLSRIEQNFISSFNVILL